MLELESASGSALVLESVLASVLASVLELVEGHMFQLERGTKLRKPITLRFMGTKRSVIRFLKRLDLWQYLV